MNNTDLTNASGSNGFDFIPEVIMTMNLPIRTLFLALFPVLFVSGCTHTPGISDDSSPETNEQKQVQENKQEQKRKKQFQKAWSSNYQSLKDRLQQEPERSVTEGSPSPAVARLRERQEEVKQQARKSFRENGEIPHSLQVKYYRLERKAARKSSEDFVDQTQNRILGESSE